MSATVDERTKRAAECSPRRSEAEPRVLVREESRARFSGPQTDLGEILCRPLKRAHSWLCPVDPGFRSLRSLHPGLNSVAGYAGSLSGSVFKAANLEISAVLGSTPEGGY